jgi:hypothetical protein
MILKQTATRRQTLTLLTALLLAPLAALHAADTPQPIAATSVVEVKDPSALTSLVRFQPYRHVIPDRRDPKTGNSVRQVSFLPGYNRAQYYHFDTRGLREPSWNARSIPAIANLRTSHF